LKEKFHFLIVSNLLILYKKYHNKFYQIIINNNVNDILLLNYQPKQQITHASYVNVTTNKNWNQILILADSLGLKCIK